MRDAAFELVALAEQGGACDVSLHGMPRRDELTSRWLVAYSGVGAACDDVGAVLQRAGLAAEIMFFRRPNPDEVRALMGKLRASVRNGFPCLIAFNGEPRFDEESDLWTMRYYGSGQQCSEAGEELERQGKAYRIAFHRIR